jgi:hypothetical protein
MHWWILPAAWIFISTGSGAFAADSSPPPVNDKVTFRIGDLTVTPGQAVSLPIYAELDGSAPRINRFTILVKLNRLMWDASIVSALDADRLDSELTYYEVDGSPVMRVEVVQSASEEIDFSKVLAPDHQGVVATINFRVSWDARPHHPVRFVRPDPARGVTLARCAGIESCPESPTLLCEEEFQPLLLPGSLTIGGGPEEGDGCPNPPCPDPTLSLGSVTAAPGESGVSVPIMITVKSGVEISHFQMAIGYDSAAMSGVSIEDTRGAVDFRVTDPSMLMEPDTVWLEATYSGDSKADGMTIDSSNSGEVARINFCVPPSATAGAHPLSIAPLVHGIWNRMLTTGLNRGEIDPIIENGSVLVSGAPRTDSTCQPDVPWEPFKATFRLGEAHGAPGGEAVVPFFIEASRKVQGYSFSLDFDEEVLQASDIERLFPAQPPGSMEFEYELLRYDNSNAAPGNAGIDEGYLVGGVIFGFSPQGWNYLPENSSDPVLRFHFKVNRDAPPGSSTELRFLDGARTYPKDPQSQPVRNGITIGGRSVQFVDDGSFVLIHSTIGILSDDTPFIRGDANWDLQVDLGDAVRILGFVFLVETPLSCTDAGDVNDDSTVDIFDAITLLSFLYSGGEAPREPSGICGVDPTHDDLGCRGFPICQ